MGGFGVNAAIGSASAVVSGAIAYKYLRSGKGSTPRYETPDNLLPDNVKGDGQILYKVRPAFLARAGKPVDRHYFDKIGKKSSVQENNTVIHSDMYKTVTDDVLAIRKGGGVLNGNTIEINGRVYGHHGREGSIFPVSGEGFAPLSQGDYLALKTIKTSESLAAAARKMDGMNAISAANRVRALQILKWGNSPLGR